MWQNAEDVSDDFEGGVYSYDRIMISGTCSHSCPSVDRTSFRLVGDGGALLQEWQSERLPEEGASSRLQRT